MPGEIGVRHFTASQEGGKTGEQSDHHQQAERDLHDARRARQAGYGQRRAVPVDAAKPPKELLWSVAEKEKAKDNPEQRVSDRPIPLWNHILPMVNQSVNYP